ncbi:LacI family DNA-binding transcriptional regulator [Pseudonocardia acaciae]|uniref:LacI family DNA-binding transcriptional regulator n=1 Tax=Pseudonocardia acaciae TaxID=551276 RepID=UPI000686C2B6|nr:LacI family DNA-binding transcriptional regulator [Pseudonocardia acaciae]
MATMSEVAEAAGCSITTVSHVLNGTRTVAAETRRQVERAMAELGYRRRVTRPGQMPRNLTAVGLTLSGVSNPYFSDLVQGVEQELARAGRVLVLTDTHDDPETEWRAVASLLAHRIEALVMAPTAGWAERAWPLLHERKVPFVLVDRMVPEDVDQVGVENEPGSCVLVEHLLRLGHRRIGMISGLSGLSTTSEREAGYRRAHRRRRATVDEALIVCGESSVDGGRRAMARLLERPMPPTAVFSGNNAMTVGALTTLERRGVRVPHDVAMVAFDDFEWSPLVRPRLTAAAQPCHAMGARAVQLLMRRLAEPDLPPSTVRIPASIEHRDSCGCHSGTVGSHERAVPAGVVATR